MTEYIPENQNHETPQPETQAPVVEEEKVEQPRRRTRRRRTTVQKPTFSFDDGVSWDLLPLALEVFKKWDTFTDHEKSAYQRSFGWATDEPVDGVQMFRGAYPDAAGERDRLLYCQSLIKDVVGNMSMIQTIQRSQEFGEFDTNQKWGCAVILNGLFHGRSVEDTEYTEDTVILFGNMLTQISENAKDAGAIEYIQKVMDKYLDLYDTILDDTEE